MKIIEPENADDMLLIMPVSFDEIAIVISEE
jgi:hypothetical protein